MKNIVSISTSSRPASYTGRALAVVNDEIVKRGVSLTPFDASTLTLGFPGQPETEDAKRLRSAVKDAAGIVLATPEYHGSFSAMAKLVIENLGFPSVLSGKPVALLGVAAGRIGAIKSLEHLRGVCAHTGAIVMPGAVSIAGVRSVFDDAGKCTDAPTEAVLRSVGTSLLKFLEDFVCPKFALEAMVRGEAPPWSATV